jgi:adenylate cyclase
MNSYLERNSDIVMKHGGTVDKFLGDGAMFRFNVPLQIRDHRVRAIQAAVEMKNDFENLKASWLNAGIPASSLQTRIGVASGPLHEAIMGHPQYQSLTVMGEPVVIAANLCGGAARDRSIILTDENSLRGLDRQIQARAVSQASLKKIKGNPPAVSEVIAFTSSATEDN